MAGSLDWIVLMFRLPREPSSPRIAVWRRLRALGVVQVVDGVVALPADSRTREQLDWVADLVIEAGGEATMWTARLLSVRQERELAQRMTEAVAAAYRAVVDEVAGAEAAVSRRTLGRLRRELRRIAARDFFPTAERDAAHAAVDGLASRLESVS